ncbi:MAG: head GIN domain-containing protein [Chitinophagales bacterium]
MNVIFIKRSIFVWLLSIAFHAGAQTNTATETRNLTGFSSVVLNVPAVLTVSQSKEFSVQLEGRKELLDEVITELKGDRLVIRYRENKWPPASEKALQIYIKLPDVKGLELNGSGSMAVLTELHSKNLALEVNGSGNIKTRNIKAEHLTATINGSGAILELGGQANTAEMEVNGSGNIDADKLVCTNASATTTGSGNISAGTPSSFDATITGSGTIFYNGNAASIKKNVTGSGKVIQH